MTAPEESQDNALVRSEGTTGVDAYEREYMPGEGAMLYRDKMVAGKKLNLFLGALAVIIVGAGIAEGTLASALIGLPIIALVWLLFGVLRVSVSENVVNVQYGVFGPKIPIHAIESATAMKYQWATFGGWGIRRGPDGWMYNMLGDGGNAVKIVWRDGAGKRKITYVGTSTAEILAEEIAKARRALPAAPERPALPPEA